MSHPSHPVRAQGTTAAWRSGPAERRTPSVQPLTDSTVSAGAARARGQAWVWISVGVVVGMLAGAVVPAVAQSPAPAATPSAEQAPIASPAPDGHVVADSGQDLTPGLNARYHQLAAELRCLVCQNQSLADSPSELSQDLKTVLREQLRAGRTDEEIVAFFVARYGEAVSFRPALAWHTSALWIGPWVGVGGLALWMWRRRREGVSA